MRLLYLFNIGDICQERVGWVERAGQADKIGLGRVGSSAECTMLHYCGKVAEGGRFSETGSGLLVLGNLLDR